jgi:Zn finger protein HypA/HybF involved in hydrogenase expression
LEDTVLTQKVAEKIDECPNCGGKVSQKDKYEIECPQCQMKVDVISGKRRKFELALIIALYASMFGLIAGLAIDLLTRVR